MASESEVVHQLSLAEKASLCLDADFWHTSAVDRFGIRSVALSDGPRGLRVQPMEGDNVGISGNLPAHLLPHSPLARVDVGRHPDRGDRGGHRPGGADPGRRGRARPPGSTSADPGCAAGTSSTQRGPLPLRPTRRYDVTRSL